MRLAVRRDQRYLAFMYLERALATHGELPLVHAADDEELRGVLRRMIEYCTAEKIYNIGIRSASPAVAAITAQLFEQQQQSCWLLGRKL